MKISVFKDEEGYCNYLTHRPISVYVDGEEWRCVIRLDSEEGWVDYHSKIDGRLQLGDDGEPVVERVYGAITVAGNGLLIEPKAEAEWDEEDA